MHYRSRLISVISQAIPRAPKTAGVKPKIWHNRLAADADESTIVDGSAGLELRTSSELAAPV